MIYNKGDIVIFRDKDRDTPWPIDGKRCKILQARWGSYNSYIIRRHIPFCLPIIKLFYKKYQALESELTPYYKFNTKSVPKLKTLLKEKQHAK